MITLKINNRIVEVEAGSTILQAAKKLDIFVPTFCFDDYERMPGKHCSNCKEFGDCKICSCEVEGEVSLLTACNTLAQDGMVVWTESEEVKKARVSILSRMIATHPLDCVNCKKLGACKLQKYCEMYGVKDPQYVIPYEHREKDMSNRFYFHEMDKCIRCGKCVRTCRELVGVNALAMAQMGDTAFVVPNGGKNMAETACISCGNCISVCPVGAIMPKLQVDFREWETTKVPTTCVYCGVGCQMECIVKDGKIVDVKPLDGPSNHGLLCEKGKFAYDFIDHKVRLKYPLIRKNGQLKEVSWEEALDLVAAKIKEVREEYGTDAITGFSSERMTDEEHRMFRKFMCEVTETDYVVQKVSYHEHDAIPCLQNLIGKSVSINNISEMKNADVILILGTNVEESHPVLAMHMRQAYRQGKKIILVDSVRTRLADFADIYLQIEPNEDLSADAVKMLEEAVRPLILCVSETNISVNITKDKMKMVYILEEDAEISEKELVKVNVDFESTFVVVHEAFMNKTAEFADVILPSAAFFEKEGIFTNMEHREQKLRKVLEPAGDSRDNCWTLMQMMNRVGCN